MFRACHPEIALKFQGNEPLAVQCIAAFKPLNLLEKLHYYYLHHFFKYTLLDHFF